MPTKKERISVIASPRLIMKLQDFMTTHDIRSRSKAAASIIEAYFAIVEAGEVLSKENLKGDR